MMVAETFPAMSVPRTTIRLTPILSEMLQEKAPLLTVVDVPLQVTPETPDRSSVTVPVTVTLEVETTEPSVGDETASVGGTLSRLTVALVVAVPPSVSVAVPLTV
jgi:hypothetical protein